MADIQQQIQLALDITGTKTLAEAIAEMERLGKAANKTDEEIELATRALRYYQEILKGATTAEDEAVKSAEELSQTQRIMAQVTDEATEALKREREAEEEIAAVVRSNADAIQQGGRDLSGLGRGFMDVEKAGLALATGHGLSRLGGILERIIGGAGGPTGIGFGIAGIAMAIEIVLPKLQHFFGAIDEEKIKKAADEMERLVKAAAAFKEIKTTEEDKVNAQFSKYVKSVGGPAIAKGIEMSVHEESFAERMAEERDIMADWQHDPQAMQERLAANREYWKKRDAAVAGQTSGSFQTDPKARARAYQMAGAHANFFPKGFQETVSRLEWGGEFQTEEEKTKQKLKDEAAERAAQKEIAAGQKKETDRIKKEVQDRQHVAQEREREWNRAVGTQDTMIHQMEGHEAAETKRLVEQTQAYSDQLGEEILRDQAKAKQTADREAVKATRADSLPGRVQAEHQFVGQQVMALDQANQAQGGTPATPGFLQHVTQQAIANVDTGQTLANAIYNAVQQTKAKIEADAAHHLHQMSQQMSGSMGHDPTQYGRGSG